MSRDSIVATASTLLEGEGVEALSARRLASELGCQAMSLYHHIQSMGELVDLIVDAALMEIPLPESDRARAEMQIRSLCLALMDLARRRPRIFQVVATHRWHTPSQLALQGKMIDLLVSTGLERRRALGASRALLGYLNGAGMALAAWQLETHDDLPLGESFDRMNPFLNIEAVAMDLQDGLERLLRSLLV